MKVTIDLKQTPRGDIEAAILLNRHEASTPRELQYAEALALALRDQVIREVATKLGATAALHLPTIIPRQN
jgi:hypothetical protein